MPLTVVDNAMLACTLEVLAYKPGNVNLVSGLKNTTLDDFLLSIYALHDSFLAIHAQAIEFSQEKISYNDINLGKWIYEAIKKINDVQGGGNTHLGTILLLFPLIFAYSLNKTSYQEQLDQLIKNTTYEDTVYLYNAINLANVPYKRIKNELDLFNSNSKRVIKEKNINIYEIMKKSENNDLIAELLANKYNSIYEKMLPFFKTIYESTKTHEKAIIATYLYTLSTFLDSHIVKKYDQKTAEYVKKRAKVVFEKYMTNFEIDCVIEFDDELKTKKINPGTAADIITATIFIFLESNQKN